MNNILSLLAVISSNEDRENTSVVKAEADQWRFHCTITGRRTGTTKVVFLCSNILTQMQKQYCKEKYNSQSTRHIFRTYIYNGSQNKLENVVINDVLPLKAARRDAIADRKCFGALRHQRRNFDGSFTFTIRRRRIRLASAPLPPSVWHFVWFRLLIFVCNAWKRSRMQNLWRVGENSGSILSRLWSVDQSS